MKKVEAERLLCLVPEIKADWNCHECEAWNRMVKQINSMTEPDEPPVHQWRVGDWAWSRVREKAFPIKGISESGRTLKEGPMELGESWYKASDCIPITTPHEIGTWINHKDVSFEIKERKYESEDRKYESEDNDWMYFSEPENGSKRWRYGKDVTAIPAPQFDVGEKAKHITVKTPTEITGREWINSCGSPKWHYALRGHDDGKCNFMEGGITRVPVHEWKVDEWFRHRDDPVLFQVRMVTEDKIFPRWANDSFYKSRCRHVQFIQVEGDEIGLRSTVKTKDGWIGIIYDEHNGFFFVGNSMKVGAFKAPELTLCPPEVKE